MDNLDCSREVAKRYTKSHGYAYYSRMDTIERQGPRFRDFTLVWLGQVISLLGSELTNFGLGVWVYQQTGSVTRLTLIFVCASVPGLLLSPLAGVYIDRFTRRRALILTNVGAALGPLALVVLLLSHQLHIFNIYLIVAVSTAFLSFQIPALAAATTLMVPREHLGRANGMLQFGGSTAQILGPFLAGLLVPILHLQGLIALDVVTFLIGIATLLLARIPDPQISAARDAGNAGELAQGSMLDEVRMSFRYLRERPGLVRLLAFFALLNFLLAMSQVLITPLVLSRGTATQLGLVLSVGGVGMLSGALLMSAWGGPERRIWGILGASPLLGLGCMLIGLSASTAITAAGIFLLLFVVPIINGCDQAIWQSKVEPDLQGRIFATRQLLEGWTAPLSYLIAGPLADRLFEPMLAPGGPLASSAGRFLGVGPGRGIGLQFILMGLLLLAASLGGLAYPRLRRIEDELPEGLPAAPIR
jgi:DHA3 family macrolide efflux protein-like MFS transporter